MGGRSNGRGRDRPGGPTPWSRGDFGGIEFAPGDARRLVLVADETALPALASIVESLPEDAEGIAVVEVPGEEDVFDVRLPAGIRSHWIARGAEPRGQSTADDLGEGIWETPVHSSSGDDLRDRPRTGPAADDTYAWVAGDSDTVKACRRLLVGEAGMPRPQVAFMGYWKQGRAG